MISSSSSGSAIESIVGEEVSGVCFVRDYIELSFDGPVLRLLGKAHATDAKSNAVFGDPDFPRLLLNAIGRRVESVDISRNGLVSIALAGGMEINVESASPGAEFAHFVSFPDKRLTVFEG
jgi:hypothetical protein